MRNKGFIIKKLINLIAYIFFFILLGACSGKNSSVHPQIKLTDELSFIKVQSLNGNMITVMINKPETDGPYPVLIGISGGNSQHVFQQYPVLKEKVLSRGILMVDFAPQGRSTSEGEDDYHGFIHQDDLKALVDFLSVQSFVDKKNIGIISFSFGVAIATGALSRYQEMPVQFLIDWEGPAAPGRDLRHGRENNEPWINDPILNHVLENDILHGGNIYDDKYWDERDAAIFAAKLSCPYLRIQFLKDHVQGNSKYHMMKIINAATENSGQWTRCNDNPSNILYLKSELDNYQFHAGSIYQYEGTKVVMDYIEEMFFIKPWLNE